MGLPNRRAGRIKIKKAKRESSAGIIKRSVNIQGNETMDLISVIYNKQAKKREVVVEKMKVMMGSVEGLSAKKCFFKGFKRDKLKAKLIE